MLNERFATIPEIAAAGCTQYTEGDASALKVADGLVNVPQKPTAGLTYRFVLAGTKTGANAAHTVTLVLGGTTLMTLTADAATAVDWMAEFVVRFVDATNQKVMGRLSSSGLDAIADYAAGTVDCSAGNDLCPYITAGNSSDEVTCEMVTVEKWIK